MKKSNPLFVDTTKFNGDSLFTQVELNGIPDYLGATVSIKVTDKSGLDQTVELSRTNENQCSGKVFLTYRQEVTYEFNVTRNDEPIFKSEPRVIEASYLIQDIWRPISLKPDFNQDIVVNVAVNSDPIPEPPEEKTTPTPELEESTQSVETPDCIAQDAVELSPDETI